MRLDQRSHWDSWKFVGRPWRYQGGIKIGEKYYISRIIKAQILTNKLSNWSYGGNWLYANQFPGAPLDVEALGISLQVNPALLLPEHETVSPNHQFSQRIWYVEYHSRHSHMAWSQKFRLTRTLSRSTVILLSNPGSPNYGPRSHFIWWKTLSIMKNNIFTKNLIWQNVTLTTATNF